MRDIFNVGAKLYGMTLLYTGGMGLIGQAIQFIHFMENPTEGMMTWMILALLASVGTVALALVLIFKTDFLAKILKIKEDKGFPNLSSSEIIRVGSILIGIAILIKQIGPFGYNAFIKFFAEYFPRYQIQNQDLIKDSSIILFSALLIFGANRVAQIVDKK